MIALIDADTVAYRCAASCEPSKTRPERDPVDLAIRRVDEMMYRILLETDCQQHLGFLSGGDNFRKVIYPLYKANRKGKEDPAWLKDTRELLMLEWGCQVVGGYEADDAIGIHATDKTIICANDKDFRQIPGKHYNFVIQQGFEVDEYEAAASFWTSMLEGDRADNIPGVPGLGAVKAKRALEGLSPAEMRDRVREIYESYDLECDFTLSYQLLRILRSELELYEIMNETILREAEREAPTAARQRRDTQEVSAAIGS